MKEPSDLVFVDVSDELAGHLAYALRRYLKYARSVGMPVPDEVRQLEQRFTLSANRSHKEPDARSGGKGVHDGHMDALTVTYADAAQALRVSRRTINRLVADGTLVPAQIGGSKRIPVEQLRRIAKGETAAARGDVA